MADAGRPNLHWAMGQPVELTYKRPGDDSGDSWYRLTDDDNVDATNPDNIAEDGSGEPKSVRFEAKYGEKRYTALVTISDRAYPKSAHLLEDGKYLRVELEYHKPRETLVFETETGALRDQIYCDPHMFAHGF